MIRLAHVDGELVPLYVACGRLRFGWVLAHWLATPRIAAMRITVTAW